MYIKLILFGILIISSLTTPVFSGLLAPIYPDSVEAPGFVPEELKGYQMVFLSRDPIDLVKNFYDKSVGPMTETAPGEYWFLLRIIDRVEQDTGVPVELGLSIKTRSPEATGLGVPDSISRRRHPYFRPLENLVGILPKKSLKDYDQVCEDFELLVWAYFIQSDTAGKNGSLLNEGELLLHNYMEAQSEGRAAPFTMEEASIRMGELMEQGRIDEMVALANQMRDATSSKLTAKDSDWDEYINLLKKIEQVAYRTKITIHKRP